MTKERGAPVNREAMDEECQFKFQTPNAERERERERESVEEKGLCVGVRVT